MLYSAVFGCVKFSAPLSVDILLIFCWPTNGVICYLVTSPPKDMSRRSTALPLFLKKSTDCESLKHWTSLADCLKIYTRQCRFLMVSEICRVMERSSVLRRSCWPVAGCDFFCNIFNAMDGNVCMKASAFGTWCSHSKLRLNHDDFSDVVLLHWVSPVA